MLRPGPDDFERFVRELDASTMADLLLELAEQHEGVRQRLARLQISGSSTRLAAAFRKPLTAWKRSPRWLGYEEAPEFGAEVQAWLGQIEKELLPRDPPAALQLAEELIQLDESLFNRADDSDGLIGDVIGAACRLWLRAAAKCESPADQWPARLDALAAADEYGAREELYRHADELLDESALRQLVDRHMRQLAGATAGSEQGKYRSLATLALLSKALRDPDVHVAAIRASNPQPNPSQIEEFVREYLDVGRAADALSWLEGPWGHMEDTRQRLRAEALGQLGRSADAAGILKAVFEESLSVYDLDDWMDLLGTAERAAASEHAHALALKHTDPVVAARLLVHLGDHPAAESTLLTAHDRIDGGDYGWLVPLAEALESNECWVGASLLYRALLNSILKRAYARAYGHGARYWKRLEAIALRGVDLGRIGVHATYAADIRSKHARKVAFWAHVNGERKVEPLLDDDDDLVAWP